jgi:8-oxo-dGTP pyrophosphatase MutT (NUDIX family)
MSTREGLKLALEAYASSFAEEQKFRISFLELLSHPRAYFRDHLPGHMTGSAWVVDSARENALLVHHVKLDRWLQPGGHADGDEDIVSVARKEAEEETGLKKLLLANPLFDIDIHSIPERKDFPRHDHYDIRCLFIADPAEKIRLSAESNDIAWVKLSEIPTKVGNNDSIIRMIRKL